MERMTLLEIKFVSDDDTGMYHIGEIDTMPQDDIAKYIRSYGETGYQELLDFCARVVTVARHTIVSERMQHSGAVAEIAMRAQRERN